MLIVLKRWSMENPIRESKLINLVVTRAVMGFFVI